MDPYQQQFVSDMQAMFHNILLWEKTCFNSSLGMCLNCERAWTVTVSTTLYFKGGGGSRQILEALYNFH